ncbi:hypothetical protein Q7P37_000536 [Cladosporium fusiforme]
MAAPSPSQPTSSPEALLASNTTSPTNSNDTNKDNTNTTNEDNTNPPTNPSITTTHRTDRSLLMALLQTCLRPFGPKITNITSVTPPGSPQLTIPKSATRRCHVTERRVNDIYIYDCTSRTLAETLDPPNPEKTKHKRIYYFAGGGWRMPASADHWAFVSSLSASLSNTTLSLVSYPLAPANPAPETIPLLLDLLPTLLHDAELSNETTILAGDSAGANLALTLPLELLRASLASPNNNQNQPPPLLPAHIILLSPSVDLRRTNPAIPQLEPLDPLLRHTFIKATSDVWRGDWPADDTRCSPLLIDDAVLHALRDAGTQVHGLTGGHDILAPDALLFRDRLVGAGVRGSWLHWEKQMHVFPLAWRYWLRESREAKEWVREVIDRI